MYHVYSRCMCTVQKCVQRKQAYCPCIQYKACVQCKHVYCTHVQCRHVPTLPHGGSTKDFSLNWKDSPASQCTAGHCTALSHECSLPSVVQCAPSGLVCTVHCTHCIGHHRVYTKYTQCSAELSVVCTVQQGTVYPQVKSVVSTVQCTVHHWV